MSKCYLIACDLQTTQSLKSSSIIRATIVVPHFARRPSQDTIYVFDVSFRITDPGRHHVPPHDEFNGNRSVSLVHRLSC
jgi:hypothetical protein